MKEYQDWFFRKAKNEGALSRAFFKLEEIDKKRRLLASGNAVLDLGCAPGSWMQYAAKRVGPTGLVIGVDRTAIKGALPARTRFVLGDLFVLDACALREKAGRYFDVVLSDAAPSTTGERFVDQQNSLRITQRVVEIALEVLRPGGHLLLKIFQGPDTKKFQEAVEKNFQAHHVEKPQSSRRESFEVYWVGLGFTSSRRP